MVSVTGASHLFREVLILSRFLRAIWIVDWHESPSIGYNLLHFYPKIGYKILHYVSTCDKQIFPGVEEHKEEETSCRQGCAAGRQDLGSKSLCRGLF